MVIINGHYLRLGKSGKQAVFIAVGMLVCLKKSIKMLPILNLGKARKDKFYGTMLTLWKRALYSLGIIQITIQLLKHDGNFP